jgi:hypothetical protein
MKLLNQIDNRLRRHAAFAVNFLAMKLRKIFFRMLEPGCVAAVGAFRPYVLVGVDWSRFP